MRTRVKSFVAVPLVLLLLAAGMAVPGHSARVLAASIPAGLPPHFGIGLAAEPDSTGLDGWMPSSGIPWDYAYQYLSGGTNTNSGWETWNASAQFPLFYAQDASSRGYLPVLSYYELLQSTGTCASCGEQQKDLSNLNNSSLMSSYYQNFKLLMQRLGSGTYGGIAGFGKTAIVHVEPDLSGYAEGAVLNNANCYEYCTAQDNNPASLTASVASSGVPEVAGLPNTYQGFNWALLHLRDLYAPNVLLAFHVSDWATTQDVGSSSDSTLDVASLGQQAGSFAAQSGTTGVPNGSGTYDLLFNDVLDRDAGYYKYVYGNSSVWWDRLNVTVPNFHRWEAYVSAASIAAGRKVIVWQVPVGNQYFATENNTNGHYQDNRVEYFFGHIAELAGAGVIGVLFGAGNGGSTVNWDGANDGITNPPSTCTTDGASSGQICNNHTSTVSDDDGGYVRMQGQQYYAGGAYPLGGGSPTATAPASATPTATPSFAATPTMTPIPTATPATTPGSSLVVGNFENSTDGFVHNKAATSMTPSTYAPAVALGKYALQVTYSIPSAWTEVQLYKVANINLSSYGTVSASVYPSQPTASGVGVKVRFMALGSDGKWYASPFQTVPVKTRSVVSWNVSAIPRSPIQQLYVCWQYTTAATGSKNQIWVDAITAS